MIIYLYVYTAYVYVYLIKGLVLVLILRRMVCAHLHCWRMLTNMMESVLSLFIHQFPAFKPNVTSSSSNWQPTFTLYIYMKINLNLYQLHFPPKFMKVKDTNYAAKCLTC